MKILALELSSARGSLAWLDGDKAEERTWPNDRKNSGPLFRQLQEITENFGPPGLIVVGLGPGSYAGTRIGISAAIGLQTATGARLVGLPSISALSGDEENYVVIGDARRQSFFWARIENRRLTGDPALLDETELRSRLQPGPVFATETLPQFAGAHVRYPSALILARLAAKADDNFSVAPLEPIYLREPHITLPKGGPVR